MWRHSQSNVLDGGSVAFKSLLQYGYQMKAFAEQNTKKLTYKKLIYMYIYLIVRNWRCWMLISSKLLRLEFTIPERISLLDRTLSYKRDSIVVLGATLPDTVPVDSDLHSLHVVLNVDDNFVVFAHLDWRTRQHSVYAEDAALHTISQHALAVWPDSVGSVGCT